MASPNSRRRAGFLLLGEIGLAGLLLQNGFMSLPTWRARQTLTSARLLEALATVATTMLLIVVAWTAVSGAIYAFARAAGWNGTAERIGRVAPLPVRKLVDAVLAAWVAMTVLTGVAPAVADDGAPHPTTSELNQTPFPHPGVSHPGLQRLHGDGNDEVAAQSVVTEHVVQPGDNLWSIAATHVHEHAKAGIRVGTYWHAVIAANRPHIRSGNPNLIYPGETILLPSFEGLLPSSDEL